MPNNRQFAVLIWCAALFVVALKHSNARASIGNVMKSFLAPILFLPIAGFLVNVLAVIIVGRAAGFWNYNLVADTVFWVLGSGAVLFRNFTDASRDSRFFRTKARQVIGLTIPLGIVLEISVMPLEVELILIPIIFMLVGVEVIGQQKDSHVQVSRIAKGCLILFGILFLGYAGYKVFLNWNELNVLKLGRQAFLPLWLNITVLPYIYLLGVYAEYDSIFRRLNYKSKQRWKSRAVVKAAVVRSYGLRAPALAQIDAATVFTLAECRSFAEAREAIVTHRVQLSSRIDAAEAAHNRLVQYAGVDGVDADGRRLDRREFDDTVSALQWLHTCHMGWWRRERRYHTGLLAKISSHSDSHGLAPNEGYHEQVAANGESWYAWRRTITSWVFAIGANGEPPNQWTYDGADPPPGPPGEDPSWGSTPFTHDVSPNW